MDTELPIKECHYCGKFLYEKTGYRRMSNGWAYCEKHKPEGALRFDEIKLIVKANEREAKRIYDKSPARKEAIRRYDAKPKTRERERARKLARRQADPEAFRRRFRKHYEKNREQYLAREKERRIKRDPSRGLRRLIWDYQAGHISFTELCRRIDERVKLTIETNVSGASGQRSKDN